MHEQLRTSPFKVLHGYQPKLIPLAFSPTDNPSADQILERQRGLQEEALAAHDIAQQKMAKRCSAAWPAYKVGNKVWLETTNLHFNLEKAKLGVKRMSPFLITEVLGRLTFQLKLPFQWRIHDVFHAMLLTPYIETDAHGSNYQNPLPDLMEGQEEYEVKAILTHRGTGPRCKYLIKWKGYPDSENTWEKEESLKHSQDLLQWYKRRCLSLLLLPPVSCSPSISTTAS